jgi:hypothetical protein
LGRHSTYASLVAPTGRASPAAKVSNFAASAGHRVAPPPKADPGRGRAFSRPGFRELRQATAGERQPLQPQPQPEVPAPFSVCLLSADALFSSLGPQHTQPQSQLVTFSAGVR